MLTFILVVFALFLVPGPAVIVTVSQSLKAGRRAGIMTGVGIAIGDLLHTLAAVLGLSAILMTSAAAFEVVKYLGVAYLVYIGIRSFFEKSKPAAKKETASMSFRQAILIELLNPKTALFFLAFLPQFVKSDGPSVTIQLLMLGLTFVIMSILYTTLLALLTSSIGERLIVKNGRISRWQGKIVGAIYIGLGLRLAMESQN
ncbi:RhtB (resistance to homoserine/threonine) family protein [Bacillus oleivorans]|uniref:RhtB (Resistance to homoserine/threonine) family protein n=1 Tax=Bacillus oleivorans TaxID=1448271 RepID=A0A285D7N3_9BACI|nr:LysE family translocator [Bacillus oleivorans]SNX75824.1 RhtB (resistance to homoserine/threonine) family protein [Bacillus oleivorans]